jgi:hypothetical protein
VKNNKVVASRVISNITDGERLTAMRIMFVIPSSGSGED